MKSAILFLAFLFPVLMNSARAAGDPQQGKLKSVNCVGCHGENGVAINEEWPNLAGQKVAYLVNQLKSFREGRRQSVLMANWAGGLKDQDMEDLAAYFSSLRSASCGAVSSSARSNAKTRGSAVVAHAAVPARSRSAASRTKTRGPHNSFPVKVDGSVLLRNDAAQIILNRTAFSLRRKHLCHARAGTANGVASPSGWT